MINVYVYNNERKIEVKGHDENVLCARVSTITQFTIELFKNSKAITKAEIKSGYSLLVFSSDGIEVFKKVVNYFYKLKKLYKNNIIIVEI